MKLSDFLQDIALNELQGSSVVELTGFHINREHLPKIIQAINQSLEYFFSIFPLKQSQVIIKLHDAVSRYYLDSDYAMSNHSSDNIKYIMDSEHEPFLDDVLLIQEVNTKDGYTLVMNDTFNPCSVQIPEYNCILIPDSVRHHKYLIVTYRAKHPRIPLDSSYDSKLTINIPASYNGALQSYVASIVYNSFGGAEYAQLGQFYYGKFKTMIEELKLHGIGEHSMLGLNIKPILRGWK